MDPIWIKLDQMKRPKYQIGSNKIWLHRIKMNRIGSNWIKLDQIGSNWIKLDQTGLDKKAYLNTFIYINTICTRTGLFVTFITYALIGPHHIFTYSIGTNTTKVFKTRLLQVDPTWTRYLFTFWKSNEILALSCSIDSTLCNLVFEHSSMSLQLAPSCDNSCPFGHSQWNEPGVLIHLPPRQRPGVFSHSSISMHT